jgi:multidrug efflux pump subunit AcrA (membrane-fusion protein)
MNPYNFPLQSFDAIFLINKRTKIKYYFLGLAVLLLIFLFLPWTQNIKTTGNITTLTQEQRPQKINSPIPGKIKKWYVKEGDFVKKGDTILILSEIKEDYLDPNLISRTQSQVDAKKGSITFYKDKISATESQIINLETSKNLKIQQLNNKLNQLNSKLIGENAELSANENELKLLKSQFDRQQKMFEEGLVSQTQLQQRSITYQNAISKKIITENKIQQTKQDLLNTKIEQTSADQDYSEKINKANGEQHRAKWQSLKIK